ncbi:hypothetical protein KSP40_PGU006532 [Platanthera guangdongensis]|uniref:Uncharacterized protein n=1 Tax=Platanthera guangdongensis TaxID=2320717 RepID=A0ABR2N144_9ASPA
MASKEIISPESLPNTSPVALSESYALAARRKKLGTHFIESDERHFPAAIGGGYAGGTKGTNAQCQAYYIKNVKSLKNPIKRSTNLCKRT